MGYEVEIDIHIEFPESPALRASLLNTLKTVQKDIGAHTTDPDIITGYFSVLMQAQSIDYNESVEQCVKPFLKLDPNLYLHHRYSAFGEEYNDHFGYKHTQRMLEELKNEIEGQLTRCIEISQNNPKTEIQTEIQAIIDSCQSKLNQLKQNLE